MNCKSAYSNFSAIAYFKTILVQLVYKEIMGFFIREAARLCLEPVSNGEVRRLRRNLF